MPHDFDIRDEIDALLKKLEAAMDETPHEEEPPQEPQEDNQTQEPAMKAEEDAKYMESPTIMVYVFDAFTSPPSSPFARWQPLPPQGSAHTPMWEADVVVEGALVTDAPEQASGEENEEDAIPVDIPPPPVAEEPFSPHRRLHPRTVGLLLTLVVVMLVALLIVALYVVPLLTASASITLIPVQTPISASTTLDVITTGTGVSPPPGQVPGRLLSTLTLSGERTVATTGVGQQEAQAAHGTLTFYNAALYAQTIPAGTLLTGADGVQVVTDSDVVIPAASYPTFGQATVSARAVQVGPMGNIGAGDIYGPCCRLNVSVASSAFVGGRNARTYPMVTQSDIRTVTTALTTSLTQSVQAALSTQVHADETLIVPVLCTPHVQSSQQVGQEATHVTVQVSETCTGETYDTQAVKQAVSQRVTQAAQARLGTGYTREGAIQITVQHVHLRTSPHGGLTLQVTGLGMWAYQFTTTELHTLAARLTGLSQAQATAVLLATPGVSQVAMQVTGNASTLPADASRIHLLVLYQP